MGLFKSEQDKRIEEKMLVKRAMANIRKYLTKLDGARDRYIEEAKNAKLAGIDSQYKLARSGLSMTIRQRQVAEQLLLNLEMNEQVRDAASVTKSFADGMSSLSKEITGINGKLDIGKAQTKMRAALNLNERTGAGMEAFLEESAGLFGDMTADTGLNGEIDALIDRETGAESQMSDLDREIDAMLKKVKG